MGEDLYVWSVCAGSGLDEGGHAYDGAGRGHGFFGYDYDTGNGFGDAYVNGIRANGLGCGRHCGERRGYGYGSGFGYTHGDGESNDL